MFFEAGLVLFVELQIFFVYYGVISDHVFARFVFEGVFIDDDALFALRFFHGKAAEFADTRVIFAYGIVDYRGGLKRISFFFEIEPQRAIGKFSEAVG